tara:strand:- start:1100 stop:1372 length:273 start_codon:yes stop_codon:yes gene_type:complete
MVREEKKESWHVDPDAYMSHEDNSGTQSYSRPIIYSPDTEGALRAIKDLGYEMKNPYNDGFTGSIMKKRLLTIKAEVEKALIDAPTYSDE